MSIVHSGLGPQTEMRWPTPEQLVIFCCPILRFFLLPCEGWVTMNLDQALSSADLNWRIITRRAPITPQNSSSVEECGASFIGFLTDGSGGTAVRPRDQRPRTRGRARRPSAPKFDLLRTFNDLTGAVWHCKSCRRTVSNSYCGAKVGLCIDPLKGEVVSRGVAWPTGFDETLEQGQTAGHA
jgi:hypothetical protein